MIKQDLVRALKRHADGADFIIKQEVARCLGVDRHTVSRYLSGLDRIGGNRYFIPEVADRILQEVK